MKETKISPPSTEAAPQPASLSAGMATLLRGKPPQDESVPKSPPAEVGRARHKRLLQVSLVMADVMLLGVILRFLLQTHQPLGFSGLSLGLLALTLGAWLSCLALWLEFKW